MRVAHFADCYHPVVNGVVTSIAVLKEALERRGHEVLLFCPGVPRYAEREPNVYRFGSCMAPFQHESRFSFPWPPKVMRALQREKVDLVHIHTPFNVGLLGMRKARREKLPVVFTHHTLWEEYTHYLGVGPKMGRWLADGVVHYFFRRSRALIAPSQEVRERVRQQGWSMPIEVVPTGIDAHVFEGGDPARVRRELGLTEDQLLFLYIGRVAKEKSIDFVLRAFDSLKDPRLVLAIVGGGPELEGLKKYAWQLQLGERVRFLGYQKRDELRNYLAAARAFLFASETETQGLVLLEAAAAGCPVVAVRASGVNEAVQEGETAFLHDSGDLSGFADSIRKLALDQETALRLSRNAVAWARSFSAEAMAERVESVYLKQIQ